VEHFVQRKLMKQEQFTNNEKSFILDSLLENLRLDGRKLYDFRSLRILFGEQTGHAEVQLGNTRVTVVVSCEMVEPYPERPTEGFFIFNTEFSPMADTSFEIGRPTEFAIELGRVVERGLRESRAIDAEALCIVAGEKVWSVRCDIHILDNGGNLIDCASIATIVALLHFRRPFTTVIGKTVTVHPFEDREPVPLSVHHIPICITFGFFHQGEVFVVDPNSKEECVMDGRMTLTMNSHREICAIQKGGGIPISVEHIKQCVRIAAVKAEEITEIIQQALKTVSKK